MWRERIPLLFLVFAFGCESGSPSVAADVKEFTPTEGALWDGPLPAGYGSWPPPYFFYFTGFAVDRDRPADSLLYVGRGYDLVKTLADSRYLYFTSGRSWRIDLSVPWESAKHREAELFYEGGFWSAGSDDERFYMRGGSVVIQLGIQDRTETQIPLDWDHSMSDAFLVAAKYVYLAMPGCAALTRIDKRTLERSVMYIDGVRYPGRGSTVVAEASDDRIVCASPTDIFAIDRWGEPARNLQAGNQELMGVSVVGEDVFWIQVVSGALIGDADTSIGKVPLAGGGGTLVARTDGGGPLLYSRAIRKLIWIGFNGLRAMDLESNEIRNLDLSNERGAFLRDITLHDHSVFAAVDGHAATTVEGKPKGARAFWIARVPLEDLE